MHLNYHYINASGRRREMNPCIIENNHVDGYRYFRIPGIIYTHRSSLIVYYECRESASDWAKIDIGMKKSRDDGATWSDRKILVCGNGKTVNNPIMFSDTDVITFLYQEEYTRTFVRKSFDDGETWSEPIEITNTIKTRLYDYTVIACGPGHGTILANGRYITNVWLCSNHDDLKSHHPSIITTIFSDDKGKTWHLGDLIQEHFLINPSEAALAEIDGKVMINIRHENTMRRRMLAYSDNGISDWHGFRYAEELSDPVCAAGMISVRDTVYFVNCRDEKRRVNLTLSQSHDFGQSWTNMCLISRTGGYSDIASDHAGTLFVCFEYWDAANPNISIVRIDVNTGI